MIGLLKKDMFLLKSHILYLPFSIMLLQFFCAMGRQSNLALLVECGVLVTSIVKAVMDVEESYLWHVFQDTLPVSRAYVVCEKYIFLTASAAAFAILQAIFNIVWSLITMRGVEPGNIVFLPMIVFAVTMFNGSMLLPFYFRFGAMRARYVHLILLTGGMMFAMILSKSVRIPQHIPVQPVVLMLALLGLGILFGFISCLLSVQLYRRRDM